MHRSRAAYLLLVLVLFCFLILLAGCTGSTGRPGTGNSSTTAASPTGPARPLAGMMPTPANYTASAHPFDFEPELAKMPEISNGYMKPDAVFRYRTLLGNLNARDPDAARWVVGMGQFAENRRISDQEMEFVRIAASSPDPLRILVSSVARAGLDNPDGGTRALAYASNASFPSGEFGYLTDDLDRLENVRGPVSPAVKEKLRSIVAASLADYELRKGLALMDELGTPAQSSFQYPVPAYNTQLDVLCHLLESRDIPPAYFRLAVASGLAYGSAEAVGDDQVKAGLPSYVSDQVWFTIETDNLLRQKGYTWQAAGYPLESDIVLLWGAAGTLRPYAYSKNDEKYPPDTNPWNHPSWKSDFSSRPMTLQEFRWSFVDPAILSPMREYMMGRGVPKTLADFSAAGYKGDYNSLESSAASGSAGAQKRRSINDTSGNPVYYSDRTSVNFDWEAFSRDGKFDSACYSPDLSFHGADGNACYDKTLDEKTLSRSINVASIQGAAVKNREDGIDINKFTHMPVLLISVEKTGTWTVFSEDIQAARRYNNAISHHTHPVSDPQKLYLENMYYAILTVPWDNYQYKNPFSRIYMDGVDATDFPVSARGGAIPVSATMGMPSGYLFRSPNAAVINFEYVARAA